LYREAALVKQTEIGKDGVTQKIIKLLTSVNKVYLATNGAHGHPDVRAMAPIKVDGMKTIWFASSDGSNKVLELQQDNHAMVYVEAPRMGGECRLWGYIEILNDKDSREHVWTDVTAEHYPEGVDSPELRALRFDVVYGTFSDKNWETTPFKIE
jgi:general stress protein 26